MEEQNDNPPQNPARRAIKSFVTRPGRMGNGQIKALAELGPKFVLPY
ncbi:MAG: tRNA (guanosine(46)-N7)-methyltransferase TrmB, partial [Rubrivivax sp.]